MLGTTRKRWDKYLWNSYNEAVSVTNMSASIRGHSGRLLGPVWLQMCFLWLLPCFKFWINCQKVKIGRFRIKARISSFPENLAIPGLRGFFPLWGKYTGWSWKEQLPSEKSKNSPLGHEQIHSVSASCPQATSLINGTHPVSGCLCTTESGSHQLPGVQSPSRREYSLLLVLYWGVNTGIRVAPLRHPANQQHW